MTYDLDDDAFGVYQEVEAVLEVVPEACTLNSATLQAGELTASSRAFRGRPHPLEPVVLLVKLA